MRPLTQSLFVLCIFAAACAQKEAVVTTPSGGQAGFAERYPSRLNGLRRRFADDENSARSALAEFKGYPAALKNTDYATVVNVVDQADATGKSSAYSEASLEVESVNRFFSEERDGLRQKVAGPVSYASTQKKCTDDLGGTAVVAMEHGVDKQLEERLRAHSEVDRYIEDHQDELGKPNIDVLEKQADKIAHTSNIAFVRLELYRREIEALLGEASEVRATLDRSVQESDAILANPQASKNKKALAQKRRTAADAARAELDSEVEQDKRGLEEMQKRIAALQNDYKAALDALLADLKSRVPSK